MKMPKLEEIFTTIAIVCHCYERVEVYLFICDYIFCFQQVKALNKKKIRNRDEE